MKANRVALATIISTSLLSLLVGGMWSPTSRAATGRPIAVATTAVLADFTRQIVKDSMEVKQLVPDGSDPHTFEPTLADVKIIARSKIAFSNNLLLEEQRLLKAISANIPKTTPHIKVAESAAPHGISLIPLVENYSLETVWLGFRVIGNGKTDQAQVTLTGVEGPGQVAVFNTGTFGQPQVHYDSSNGFNDDILKMPANAHTHLSWAFSKPGIYRLKLSTPNFSVKTDADNGGEALKKASKKSGTTVLTFAVGVDPHRLGAKHVLFKGHHDLALDLERSRFTIAGDEHTYDPKETVVAIPNLAVTKVPPTPGWRFLGRPGNEVYVLAQAVLGKHVHGELDPHAWLDVKNAIAYVQTMAGALSEVMPQKREEFNKNAAEYIKKLRQLDVRVKNELAQIPKNRRNLVTTHDAYGYLAKAYGIRVAGFITPNPALKPSASDLVALHRTLRELRVPAVFLEPNQANRSDLLEVAAAHKLQICEIHSDTFTPEIHSYIELMTVNAKNLKNCLVKEKR